jgi:beta-galactosidase
MKPAILCSAARVIATMTPRRIFLVVALAWAGLSPAAAFVPPDSDAQWQTSLNGDWTFKLNGPAAEFVQPEFDDSAWPKIRVPGNWEMQGFEEPIYKEPREGQGLYRRKFAVPDAWRGRRLILRFDGVLFGYECWLNGARVGSFESGFNRCDFDVTSLVKLGAANTLAVRVYRRFKGWHFDTNDDWALSGIYRDVTLLSVPTPHIRDFTVVTDLNGTFTAAEVRCRIELATAAGGPRDATIAGTLLDPSGRVVGGFETAAKFAGHVATVSAAIGLPAPLLWNAETPHLYTLNLELRHGGQTLHATSCKVGIRQSSIDGDVLKLNGVAIKLRGVNHHDLHPAVGRAMTAEQFTQDVELMKRGNLNAVRTSHYPPSPALLDICDRLGIYVICEVPFGFGDKDLTDPTYQDILLRRAEATVSRDKNHPCVLIWSVGNENPITPLVVATAKRVKELDPTRYRLLPGAQSHRGKRAPAEADLTELAEKTPFVFDLPEGVEILAPHYPYAARVPGRSRSVNLTDLAGDPKIKSPIVITEYNHALGNAFEGLKERWEIIQRERRLSGAFIWHFQDQGLARKVPSGAYPGLPRALDDAPTAIGDINANVWLSETQVLDGAGDRGQDGIVDADRFPQADYWITRKVHSPIVILRDRVTIQPGAQTIELPVENRYDFTDLAQVAAVRWITVDGTVQGEKQPMHLSLAPRTTGKIRVDVTLPADLTNREVALNLAFKSLQGRAIYERTIRLLPDDRKPDFAARLEPRTGLPLKTEQGDGMTRVSHPLFEVRVDSTTGRISLRRPGASDSLLEGPIVRVGRKASMAEERNYPAETRFWERYLLTDARLRTREISDQDGKVVIRCVYDHPREDAGHAGEFVESAVTLTVFPQGWIDVAFALTPRNATGSFLELGLGFSLPREMGHLTWLGQGPYAGTWHQNEGNERGAWHIFPRPITEPQGRLYPGNREGVDLATVTTGAGEGIGVLADSATVLLEDTGERMIFSQVAISSGRGNKTGGMLTLHSIPAAGVGTIKGAFRIVPLRSSWAEPFATVLRPAFTAK